MHVARYKNTNTLHQCCSTANKLLFQCRVYLYNNALPNWNWQSGPLKPSGQSVQLKPPPKKSRQIPPLHGLFGKQVCGGGGGVGGGGGGGVGGGGGGGVGGCVGGGGVAAGVDAGGAPVAGLGVGGGGGAAVACVGGAVLTSQN